MVISFPQLVIELIIWKLAARGIPDQVVLVQKVKPEGHTLRPCASIPWIRKPAERKDSSKNSSSGKVTDLLNLPLEEKANLAEVRIPKTYREATRTAEAADWEGAMDKEMQVMYDRKVWNLVEPPKVAKVLGCRWVYSIKHDEQNEIVRYKACLVAQGFKQVKDSDYAANRDDRVSIGGYILLDETPISWRTFKQKCISLSTMEAEFVTLTEAAKELIWLKDVLENELLKLELNDCLLLCDSQVAISFSNSPFENHKTKHIHVRLNDGVTFPAGWCVNRVWVSWMSMSSPRYRLNSFPECSSGGFGHREHIIQTKLSQEMLLFFVRKPHYMIGSSYRPTIF
ncbi:retrovirus-related Pol polyprotein from transposon TNT 1-94 [Trichonephila clavipes]|nr:retrovirus-related Pol polyprotein from transposon TNT 1-94 [Trichonephila clavipes]